jgi:hypothetical protein
MKHVYAMTRPDNGAVNADFLDDPVNDVDFPETPTS